MVRKSQVALHVRVKLNSKFKAKSMAEEYLEQSEVIYIADQHIYNNIKGEYVRLSSGSPLFGSGWFFLDQIDLEFPVEIE